jgi:hypothetical protein
MLFIYGNGSAGIAIGKKALIAAICTAICYSILTAFVFIYISEYFLLH